MTSLTAASTVDLSHLLADIRAELADVGLKSLRDMARPGPDIKVSLSDLLRRVEAARSVVLVLLVQIDVASIPETLARRERELGTLAANLQEAVRRVNP